MLALDHCPKCQSNHVVKAGFAYGKQRYRCKGCKHHFTVLHKSTKKDESIRKLAIDMYLEGLGFRAIGRVLGIGHSTVYYWIKELGIKHQDNYNDSLNQNNESTDIVELDEIHSYAKLKKTKSGLGLLSVEIPSKS
ncbi:hypothetical protein A9Z63_12640 [Moraxella lacunata]|uniref:Transposase and inactivated derivatives n=1 Tax=Moraxella lacunata TaxID=477 RepID=A0A1B8PVM6_MORLA|nr:hypothetical protein A9309_11410 [Moraxella lacunata]OBX65850.1 hypothetical protein A9Z63_12640 [Moraxella lacunata]